MDIERTDGRTDVWFACFTCRDRDRVPRANVGLHTAVKSVRMSLLARPTGEISTVKKVRASLKHIYLLEISFIWAWLSYI